MGLRQPQNCTSTVNHWISASPNWDSDPHVTIVPRAVSCPGTHFNRLPNLLICTGAGEHEEQPRAADIWRDVGL